MRAFIIVMIDGESYHFKCGEYISRLLTEISNYGVHVCLNFHRAPGYCANPGEKEPFNLWHDNEAVEAFAWHWRMFAKRYKGISSEKLSFNLVNEPPGEKDGVTLKDYRRAIEAAVKAIREVDPSRLIIVDGMDTGNTPCPELGDLEVAQSCRAYISMSLTHYKARWWKDHQQWTEVPHWPEMAGDFGILDSNRPDCRYEDWRGHNLDRAMLDILQSH